MVDNLKNFSKTDKILVHACCGICSAYPISYLSDVGYEPVVYFYNPNIDTIEEYSRRLEAQKTVCEHFKCELIIGNYEPEVYCDYVRGYENEPEKGARCTKCFQLRLENAAKLATEMNIKEFTTSMVISPHKDYEKLTAIGNNIAQKYNLVYNSTNFRKKDGFLKTNLISKSLGLYRQNYCGCKWCLHKN